MSPVPGVRVSTSRGRRAGLRSLAARAVSAALISSVAVVTLGGTVSTGASASAALVTPATHLKAGVMPKAVQRNTLQTQAAIAGAHLTYYGGKVIPNVQVTQVLYGSGTYTPEVSSTNTANGATIASFYAGVTNSPYFDMLNEYNTVGLNGQDGQPGGNQAIGRGTYNTQVQITPAARNNRSRIDDTQIRAELHNQIVSGHLPAPTVNTLYTVYFPANKTITQGGSSSGVQFCAYHGTVPASGGVGEFYYSVLPDFTTGGMTSGCGNGTRFQNEMSVSSHELSEATTDAEVGIATTVARPLAWYDSVNGENGDICNAQQATITGGDGFSYTVQKVYSNRYNDCIASPPGVASDFSFSVNPTGATVVSGSATTSTVSTTATSGSGTVALTASGAPTGVSVSFNPSSVAAGGTSTMTIATTASAVAGNYTITVTGTEASTTHTAAYSLTVTVPAGNDFSISASPSSASVAPGAGANSTISTAVTSGSVGTVSVVTSGAPAGVTVSVNPTTVTAGGSSTLTISTTNGAAAGTYAIAVTGTEGSATHSTTFSLTITGASGGVTNGGFETGSLAGWASSGSTAVVSSGAQAGTYAARVGSTSPSTDSSIAQTFTAPAGATGLSFYYDVFCPDTVTYDWATATLADTTAGTTSTPLSKTCVNPSSGWKQVTASLTAGHSYTLTLSSHDDNYAADPTYTLYDSVSVTTTAPPPPGGVTNGGFETGTFAGWTPSGAHTAIVTSPHSGSYSAEGGNTTPTNGDSSIVQTFTVPAGKSTLSAWYASKCPDTVTYDWTTITLRDNTTGTTATLLPRTCAATYTWSQVSGAVTAGHSYTLTLTNHDDNYAADPTYSLFDDIGLN